MESRFEFVGTVSHNLEATHTKVNKFASVEPYFWSMKIPLEAYQALYLCSLETVLRES